LNQKKRGGGNKKGLRKVGEKGKKGVGGK